MCLNVLFAPFPGSSVLGRRKSTYTCDLKLCYCTCVGNELLVHRYKHDICLYLKFYKKLLRALNITVMIFAITSNCFF